MFKSSYRILVATVMAAIGLTAYSQHATKTDPGSADSGPSRLGVSRLEGKRILPVRENVELPGKRFPSLNVSLPGQRMSRIPMMAPNLRNGLEFYGSIVYAEQQSPGVNYPGREWSLAKFTPAGDFTPLYDCYKANGGGVFILADVIDFLINYKKTVVSLVVSV